MQQARERQKLVSLSHEILPNLVVWGCVMLHSAGWRQSKVGMLLFFHRNLHPMISPGLPRLIHDFGT